MISIIIPVFNVENEIYNCFESVAKQSYKDVEIIFIDDGSEDSSGRICDLFAKKDSRVRVIHQRNKGLSAARNKGLELARGEYVGFVDSDDVINKFMYEILYNNIVSENCDVSICALEKIKNDIDSERISMRENEEVVIMNASEVMYKVVVDEEIKSYAVNKLYKKKLFDKIRFPEGKIFEDKFTFYKIINISKKIAISSYVGYYYILRENSLNGAKFNSNKYDIIEASLEIISFCSKEYPKLVPVAKMATVKSAFYLLNHYIRSGANQVFLEKKVVQIIKKYKREYLRSTEPTLKQKIAMLLLLINYKLYRAVLIQF